jgi:hypothetical protein
VTVAAPMCAMMNNMAAPVRAVVSTMMIAAVMAAAVMTAAMVTTAVMAAAVVTSLSSGLRTASLCPVADEFSVNGDLP